MEVPVSDIVVWVDVLVLVSDVLLMVPPDDRSRRLGARISERDMEGTWTRRVLRRRRLPKLGIWSVSNDNVTLTKLDGTPAIFAIVLAIAVCTSGLVTNVSPSLVDKSIVPVIVPTSAGVGCGVGDVGDGDEKLNDGVGDEIGDGVGSGVGSGTNDEGEEGADPDGADGEGADEDGAAEGAAGDGAANIRGNSEEDERAFNRSLSKFLGRDMRSCVGPAGTGAATCNTSPMAIASNLKHGRRKQHRRAKTGAHLQI